MIPVLLDGPALEPISLAEAKLWLKVDGPEEDDLIRALIVAARLMVEAEIGQVLLGQTWRLVGDRWPAGERIMLRTGPVLGVVAARVFDAAGVATPIPPGDFTVLAHEAPPAIEGHRRDFGGVGLSLRSGVGLRGGAPAAFSPSLQGTVPARVFSLPASVQGEEAFFPPFAHANLEVLMARFPDQPLP